MNKINIIAGTNNFGLGPVGKLSSIVNSTRNDFNWYACGNKFDLNIFDKNIFKDILFSKDIDEINRFVRDNNITHAVVVLDVELSKILLSLGIKVVFVDSLPFMWTQADVDEGLLPLDATAYCAQKCINLTENSKKVLSQINNLCWVNPIQSEPTKDFSLCDDDYVLINVGGLHSPIGNGESYILTVILSLVEIFVDKNMKIIITCGSDANKAIRKVLKEKGIKNSDEMVYTLKQGEFLSAVQNSYLFITSPGLTTIYETSSLNVPTILIPPQNLSQFYNIEFAKKILNRYKTMYWDVEKLCFNYLNKIIDKGETYVVEKIYEYITELVDSEFNNIFKDKFNKLLNEDYMLKENSDFVIDGNGVDDIKEILFKLSEGEKSDE